jgi:hypothetical protein
MRFALLIPVSLCSRFALPALQPSPSCYRVGLPAVGFLFSTAVKLWFRSLKLLHSRRTQFRATQDQSC